MEKKKGGQRAQCNTSAAHRGAAIHTVLLQRALAALTKPLAVQRVASVPNPTCPDPSTGTHWDQGLSHYCVQSQEDAADILRALRRKNITASKGTLNDLDTNLPVIRHLFWLIS